MRENLARNLKCTFLVVSEYKKKTRNRKCFNNTIEDNFFQKKGESLNLQNKWTKHILKKLRE